MTTHIDPTQNTDFNRVSVWGFRSSFKLFFDLCFFFCLIFAFVLKYKGPYELKLTFDLLTDLRDIIFPSVLIAYTLTGLADLMFGTISYFIRKSIVEKARREGWEACRKWVNEHKSTPTGRDTTGSPFEAESPPSYETYIQSK